MDEQVLVDMILALALSRGPGPERVTSEEVKWLDEHMATVNYIADSVRKFDIPGRMKLHTGNK